MEILNKNDGSIRSILKKMSHTCVMNTFFHYVCHMNETKNKILQSAITVWGKNLAATLDDIASHTGISRRTLHRHYTGRDDLMNSVFDHIIEEYLTHLKIIIQNSSSDKDQLKAFLEFDINSSKKYMVFCQLRQAEYAEIETENDAFQELYSIYLGLFERLKENKQTSEKLTLQWLEIFYLTVVEASSKSIDAGLNKKECINMAWSSMWNGIKSDNQ